MWSIETCGRVRRERIDQADRLISEAGDLVDQAERSKSSKASMQRRRKAALLYERSARLYRLAGLGICGLTSWEDAADCWADLGDEKELARCEARIAEIDPIWEEAINE